MLKCPACGFTVVVESLMSDHLCDSHNDCAEYEDDL